MDEWIRVTLKTPAWEAKNSDRNFCTILLLECVLACESIRFFQTWAKKTGCSRRRQVCIETTGFNNPGLTIASFIFDMYSGWIFHWKKFLIEDLCGMVMSSERRRSTCEWTFVGRNKLWRIDLGAKRPVTGSSTRDNFDNSLSKCVLTNRMNQGNTGNPRGFQSFPFLQIKIEQRKKWR